MSQSTPFSIERTRLLNAINAVGRLLEKVHLDPFKLQAGAIIRKAKKQARFQGAVPAAAQQGLEQLLQAINAEARPNPFGKLAMKSLLERTLCQRLQLEQAFQAQPEILKTAIKAPVFIIGMPRTGTTILHALMHEDPAHRSPLAWECLTPYPVSTPDNFHNHPQLEQVRKELEQLFQLVPDFKKKHHLEADAPQECLGITAFDFNSFQTAAQLYIPSYLDWFINKADKLGTMQFHKRFLQYLQSGGVQAERWLLKSPVHLMRLEEIFAVYPDAKIIMPHRHPKKVVASAASLVSSVRTLYSDHEDPHRTGREQLEIWSSYFNRFLESRKKLNKEDQIIDVKFEDFVQDQIAYVKGIYAHFGWDLSEEALRRMQAFLKENPKDKHGAHQYSLEQFGLTEEDVNSAYHHYIQFLNQLPCPSKAK